MGLKSRAHLYAEEHQRHVAYHGRQPAQHDTHQELEAAARHRTAAGAHEPAAAAPLDEPLSGTAMRASAMADEVSQRVRKTRQQG